MKKFDNDRLLSRFRETAGLDTKKIAPYGGWEDGWLGGHSVGHYLTAIAQAVKATGNADLKEKSKQLIEGLAECQNKLGTGFIFGAKIETEGYVEKQKVNIEVKNENTEQIIDIKQEVSKLLISIIDEETKDIFNEDTSKEGN